MGEVYNEDGPVAPHGIEIRTKAGEYRVYSSRLAKIEKRRSRKAINEAKKVNAALVAAYLSAKGGNGA